MPVKTSKIIIRTTAIADAGPTLTPRERAERYAAKTGADVSLFIKENFAILELSKEFGMLKASGNSLSACDPITGDYLRVMNNFADLAYNVVQLSEKKALLAAMQEYFHKVTDRNGNDFSYHLAEAFNTSNWQSERDQAFICYARFTKEVEAMTNHIIEGYQTKTDGASQGKVKGAKKFMEAVAKVKAAMEKTGCISEEALTVASEAKAAFFPKHIAQIEQEQKTPQIASAAAAPVASTPSPPTHQKSHVEAQTARREVQKRPSIQRKLLIPLKNSITAIPEDPADMLTALEPTLKHFGNVNDGVLGKTLSAELMAGRQTLANTFGALSDPLKPLDMATLEGFANKLDAIEEALHVIAGREKEIKATQVEPLANFTDYIDSLKIATAAVLNHCHEIQPSKQK